MKIVFFGTPELARQFLHGLVQVPQFEVVGVVTQPDEPVGRKRILTPPPVKALALEHGIPVFQPTKLKDPHFLKSLADLQADVGVVIAYGRILPENVLNAFPHGLLNVHPSLLPKYRGPSPIVAAIANGDADTGVSIIKLVPQMDAGPIMAQTRLAVSPQETQVSLTDKVIQLGVPLLLKTLEAYVHKQITPQEQDHSQAVFCQLLTRADGELDWSQPAEVLERQVRAYNPWPGTATAGLKIFRVLISDKQLPVGEQLLEAHRMYIGTSTQALEILELQPAGGKRMLAGDYIRGRRSTTAT
jgi:methionyl-tRNA formyltransferase